MGSQANSVREHDDVQGEGARVDEGSFVMRRSEPLVAGLVDESDWAEVANAESAHALRSSELLPVEASSAAVAPVASAAPVTIPGPPEAATPEGRARSLRPEITYVNDESSSKNTIPAPARYADDVRRSQVDVDEASAKPARPSRWARMAVLGGTSRLFRLTLVASVLGFTLPTGIVVASRVFPADPVVAPVAAPSRTEASLDRIEASLEASLEATAAAASPRGAAVAQADAVAARKANAASAAGASVERTALGTAPASKPATKAEDPAHAANVLARQGDDERARGNLVAAEHSYEFAVKQNPRYFPARLALADVRWDAGEKADAKAAYQAITEEFPASLIPARVAERLAAP